MILLTSFSLLPNYKNFAIYGHGTCARHLYKKLLLTHRKNFLGFIVSDNYKIEENEVYYLKQILKMKMTQNLNVIIASTFYEEIHKILSTHQFKNLYLYPEKNFECTKGYQSEYFYPYFSKQFFEYYF